MLLQILSDSSVTFSTSSVSTVVAATELFCCFCVDFEDNIRFHHFITEVPNEQDPFEAMVFGCVWKPEHHVSLSQSAIAGSGGET